MLGEIIVKLDGNGRFKFPAGWKRKLDPSAAGSFMVRKGFEQCLVLYPMNEWEKLSGKLEEETTPFRKDERRLIRKLTFGSREVALDSADRLLIPKEMLEFAGIKKELVLLAQNTFIEIWEPEALAKETDMTEEEFSALAEKYLSKGNQNKEGA